MWLPDMNGNRTLSWSVNGLALALVAAALLLSSGCGFQLRGATPLPAQMAITYIQGKSTFDPLNNEFRDALEGRGAQVTGERDAATAILRILENRTSTDVLTVDSAGKAEEYEIRQTIRFDVITADRQVVVVEQTLSMNRFLHYIRSDVLGTEREGELIRKELQRSLVNLAMLRIAAAGGRRAD
ncbi:MAG: LPS assembly lipoprotein LptE [Gammaproteobacteria bacterium]|nr:LPS assembly lipoprotein LptE [Gammaproteobacteria bacterium]